MKTIEQLELNLEARQLTRPDGYATRAPVLMVEAKWWFDQIKKAVERAPDLTQRGSIPQNRKFHSRYKVV